MFSKAEVEIVLAGKNHFRPNDIVKGEVVVTAKKDFSLNVLQFVFRSELVNTMKQVIEASRLHTGEILSSRVQTHTDRQILINNNIDLGVGLDDVNMNMKKGDSKRFGFEFPFPEFATCKSCGRGTRLPSTNFSTTSTVNSLGCKVAVVHFLTATVEPSSSLGKGQAEIFLRFRQTGDENLLVNSESLSYRSVQLWEGKIKKFVDSNYEDYGDDNVATEGVECIANPLDEAHNHSRSIRKFFNSSYKKENYGKLVGDVEFELELLVKKKIVYVKQDVRDFFSLTFRTRVPYLQPDYLLYSKKSSQLGLFSIRSASIVLIRKYLITANSQEGVFEQRTNLFNTRYGHELTFDIVDFTPNYQDPTLLEWTIPIKELLFSKEILFSSDKPNYVNGCGKLNISHYLSVTLSVSEDFEATPKPIELVFDIKVM
ncbi:hypothetical protein CLIB1423_12S03268 [[Candida] railenensis]|uniref:Uncharacterized protein n=1 Tax=[Candida] railenensis TaxID=45579 RepID=A0A9P0VZA1_9ASCO|nr:hypothetical protein CLIB1423_12S03268 [[Candida] railenensis]